MVNKRRGPRTGKPNLRAHILAAAQARFLSQGYGATSLRAVARDAEVDHSLVNYYFGTKERLFGAVMALTLSPAQVLRTVLEHGSPTRLAESLLAAIVATWDRPEYRLPLSRLLAEAGSSPEVRRAFTGYLEKEVVHHLAAQIGGREATNRAAGAAATISGLVFCRYILDLEPLASMSQHQVIRYVRPALAASLAPGPVAAPPA